MTEMNQGPENMINQNIKRTARLQVMWSPGPETVWRTARSPATQTPLQGSEARTSVGQPGLPLAKAVVAMRPPGLPLAKLGVGPHELPLARAVVKMRPPGLP